MAERTIRLAGMFGETKVLVTVFEDDVSGVSGEIAFKSPYEGVWGPPTMLHDADEEN